MVLYMLLKKEGSDAWEVRSGGRRVRSFMPRCSRINRSQEMDLEADAPPAAAHDGGEAKN